MDDLVLYRLVHGKYPIMARFLIRPRARGRRRTVPHWDRTAAARRLGGDLTCRHVGGERLSPDRRTIAGAETPIWILVDRRTSESPVA
jgi:hypothetical protein